MGKKVINDAKQREWKKVGLNNKSVVTDTENNMNAVNNEGEQYEHRNKVRRSK